MNGLGACDRDLRRIRVEINVCLPVIDFKTLSFSPIILGSAMLSQPFLIPLKAGNHQFVALKTPHTAAASTRGRINVEILNDGVLSAVLAVDDYVPLFDVQLAAGKHGIAGQQVKGDVQHTGDCHPCALPWCIAPFSGT